MPKHVIVLGMHRSGTSCLAGFLQACGLHLGDDLFPGEPQNLDGYFESSQIVEINDAILARNDGAWDRPPESCEINEDLAMRMRAALGRLGERPLSGWKDPRTVLTFPAWKPLLGEYQIVACLRNPNNVARSLAVRDGTSHESGLGLWMAYNERLMQIVESERGVLWFDFDEAPVALIRSLQWICDGLGLQMSPDARQRFNPYLRHHDLQELPRERGCRSLYQQMWFLAHYGVVNEDATAINRQLETVSRQPLRPAANVPPDTASIRQIEERIVQVAHVAQRQNQLLQTCFERTKGLDTQARHVEGLMARLETQVRQVHGVTAGLDVQVQQIEGLQASITSGEERIAHCESRMQQLADQLHERLSKFSSENSCTLASVREESAKLLDGQAAQIVESKVRICDLDTRLTPLESDVEIVYRNCEAVQRLSTANSADLNALQMVVNALSSELKSALGELQDCQGDLKKVLTDFAAFEGRETASKNRLDAVEAMRSNQAETWVSDIRKQGARIDRAHCELRKLSGASQGIEREVSALSAHFHGVTRALEGQQEQDLKHQRAAATLQSDVAVLRQQLEQLTAIVESRKVLRPLLGEIRAAMRSRYTSVRSALARRIQRQPPRADVVKRLECPPLPVEFTQLFDAEYYLLQNAEVAASGHDPLAHFWFYGSIDKRNPHPLFDTAYYLRHNPDLADSGINPLLHYVTIGAKECRQPHPMFDPAYYLAQASDVGAKGLNPLLHYIKNGWREGNSPHPLFDIQYYLSENKDIAARGIDPLAHYVTHGDAEGRRPSRLFDPTYYRAQYADVAVSKAVTLVHFLVHGAKEFRNPHPLFDTAFYVTKYPEVANCGMNPLVHYLKHGAFEHRDPTPMFCTGHYLHKCPNPGAVKDPLDHYLREGWRLGYEPNRRFSPSYYLSEYGDQMLPGEEPLVNFCLYGFRKGFNPHPLFDCRFYLDNNPGLVPNVNPLVHYLTRSDAATAPTRAVTNAPFADQIRKFVSRSARRRAS